MRPLNSLPSNIPAAILRPALVVAFCWGLIALQGAATAQDTAAVALPAGVKAVWDTAKAFHETTPTR